MVYASASRVPGRRSVGWQGRAALLARRRRIAIGNRAAGRADATQQARGIARAVILIQRGLATGLLPTGLLADRAAGDRPARDRTAREPAARKLAARKPANRKPADRKLAARKPATRIPAAREPAARKLDARGLGTRAFHTNNRLVTTPSAMSCPSQRAKWSPALKYSAGSSPVSMTVTIA